MKRTLRALAALLGYPSAELQQNIESIREAVKADATLKPASQRKLDRLFAQFQSEDLLSRQAAYTELFDRSRSLSLHLFEHVHGDSRERGQAMIDLGEQYLERGFLLSGSELPDFVPAFVEFASCLPPAEAAATLAEPVHVFAALEQRLQRRNSPYAAIFSGLIEIANSKPDAAAVAELEARAPVDDPARIDEEWEEKAVTFTGPHDMGGPTSFFAKLRAANRPVQRD